MSTDQADPAWVPCAEELSLTPGQVHVWRAFLAWPASEADPLSRILSEDEREKAARFRFQRDAARFRAARGALRVILGRYLHLDPARVRFRYESHGKPLLDGCDGQDVCFNLAHADDLALYAFTRQRRVGIDLEYVRALPDINQMTAQFLSSDEREALHSLPLDQQCEAFYHCWTRKEAYLKAIGVGLTLAPKQLAVSLAPGEPAHLLHVAGHPEQAAHWSLMALRPEAGCVAALAVEGHDWQLACRTFCW